jgi:hypothetical protein
LSNGGQLRQGGPKANAGERRESVNHAAKGSSVHSDDLSNEPGASRPRGAYISAFCPYYLRMTSVIEQHRYEAADEFSMLATN